MHSTFNLSGPRKETREEGGGGEWEGGGAGRGCWRGRILGGDGRGREGGKWETYNLLQAFALLLLLLLLNSTRLPPLTPLFTQCLYLYHCWDMAPRPPRL